MASSYQGQTSLPGTFSIPTVTGGRQTRDDPCLRATTHVKVETPVAPDTGLERFPHLGRTSRHEDVTNTSVLAESQPPSKDLQCTTSKIANIRIRRSQHASSLLSSPARSGHTARMRQVFEDAGRLGRTKQPTLYPQLPNVSRPTSASQSTQFEASLIVPARDEVPRPTTNELPLISQLDLPKANISTFSDRTSGSWSDDSGYFIADVCGRTSIHSIPLKQRIHNWLLAVPTNEQHDGMRNDSENIPDHYPSAQQYTTPGKLYRHDPKDELFAIDGSQAERGLETPGNFPYGQVPHTELDEHDNSTLVAFSPCKQSEEELYSLEDNHSALDCTQLSAPSTQTPHSVRKEALTPNTQHLQHLDLSLLSPNVCIERGPSRYHSPRTTNPGSSPRKLRSTISFQKFSLQENMIPSGEDVLGTGSPLASPLAARKARSGTRFQRTQYNTHTFNIMKGGE
ncbi:hypothetical protein IQ07DRAFT_674962 [Pyrenochaeta sp. DS3sAY3a]|nr:hypothetical protein IQ07DRAFT_674962 [Pyrenochaeta sp. DS3sAY3a]